jgi:hypothetical protein
MNPQRINWRSISEPNLYGWEATIGNRRAQVVRAYTSDWRVFAWIGGRKCKGWESVDKPGHPNASAARKQAGQFLRVEFTPETWPAKDDPLDNDFLRGYLECALWTGRDESDEAGGDPLDRNYDVSDFAPETVTKAAAECEAFQAENADDLTSFYEVWPFSPDGDSKEAFAGHNFWLTRNGHGVGFWDRDAGEVGDRLTEASRKAGERYVYVGDDGQLWIS